MLWPFVKYVGCGNDFIILDNRKEPFPCGNLKLIQKLCHRQWGIGADGLILLEKSTEADFRMRIFNSDGSEAEMCGNGIRCLVKWYDSHLLGSKKATYTVETKLRFHQASVEGSDVCIDMGLPTHIDWNVSLEHQEKPLHFHSLSTGVPHAVHFHEAISTIDLTQLGPVIRRHPFFKEGGTNVTLAQQLDATHFKMRTFERGVEGETLGCGTGATAVALCAAYRGNIKSGPLTIHMAAGDVSIGFDYTDGVFSAVTMTGPATPTFSGHFDCLLNENSIQ